MTNPDENARRLLRALTAHQADDDHGQCLRALPLFVEAELAGEDVVRLYPQVQAHLDNCRACAAEHAAMLDLLLTEAAGELPAVTDLPPLRLPADLSVRRWVRRLATAAWPGQPNELEAAASAFFDLLASPGGRLAAHEPAAAYAAGTPAGQATAVVVATYQALRQLAEELRGHDLSARTARDLLMQRVDAVAVSQAERFGLRGEVAQRFATRFPAVALQDLDSFAELIHQLDEESSANQA